VMILSEPDLVGEVLKEIGLFLANETPNSS